MIVPDRLREHKTTSDSPGSAMCDAIQEMLRASAGTPFLFVSGTIGEDRAIDALQCGAADYVLKDNLRRLPSAVTR